MDYCPSLVASAGVHKKLDLTMCAVFFLRCVQFETTCDRLLFKLVMATGENFIFKRGARVQLHASDAEVIKEVLSTKFDDYEKCRAATLVMDILGTKGLGFAEHEEWARQRRVVRPAYYPGKVKVLRYYLGLNNMHKSALLLYIRPILSKVKPTEIENFLNEILHCILPSWSNTDIDFLSDMTGNGSPNGIVD